VIPTDASIAPIPDPSWRRSRPPLATLRWAAAVCGRGARIIGVRPIGRGAAMAIHALDVRSGPGVVHRLILRRWTRPGWRDEGPDDPAHELRTLVALRDAPFPVPLVVAFDLEGTETDVPCLLLERLAGRAPTYAATRRRSLLDVLARVAVELHAMPGPLDGARVFAPYYSLDAAAPLPASQRPALWHRAIEIASLGPPPGAMAFIHRDFHPANTLWLRSRLTGVLDWTSACRGPVAMDLAHLRLNLGIGHDPSVADQAIAAFEAAGEQQPDQPWWAIRSVLDVSHQEWGDRLGTGEGLLRVERYLGHLIASWEAHGDGR